MKNNNLKLILNWLAVFAWLGIIFFFSNQPDLKSDFEPVLDLILRKIAHLAEYFVLSFLFFRVYRSTGFRTAEALVLTLIAAVIAAGFDEFHQLAVAGRVGSLKDIMVDAIGALIFLGLKINEGKKIS